MTLKRLRGGRLASIISGLVLGASALLNPINARADHLREYNLGDGASVNDTYMSQKHSSDTNDTPWSSAPPPTKPYVKVHTEPYGVELQADARELTDESTFNSKLSVVSDTGAITSTNQLYFDFTTPGYSETNRDYAAKIYCDGTYTPTGSNFDRSVDIRDVISLDGGYVNLPGITNVGNGIIYGTVDVGHGFYLDKIFLTNKAANAGSEVHPEI